MSVTTATRVIEGFDAHDRFASVAGLPVIDRNRCRRHGPATHLVALRDESIAAHCSLWWRDTPHDDVRRTGLIGHYAAADDEAANTLLARAGDVLGERGCDVALGPMDGNTWRDYRFVVEGDERPPFFLEPRHPGAWPQQFLANGFRPVTHYFSTFVPDLGERDPRLDRVRRRMKEQGVDIRAIRSDGLDEDLAGIHAVATRVFRHKDFYVDVGLDEFRAQYLALRDVVPLDLVLLAEQRGRTVGFVFALPDLVQARGGKTPDTVIVKTLGVLPGREFAGLGQVLLEAVHQRAAVLGFRHAIHALVREVGSLQRIALRYGRPMRRYALFGRDLAR